MNKIFLLVVVAGLFSCQSKVKTDVAADSLSGIADSTAGRIDSAEFNYEKFQRIESYLVKGEPSTDQVQVIDSTSAVIINPTDEQIDAMLKENGEEDFATIADDYSYYQSTAYTLLDSFAIRKYDANKRYLKFKGDSGTWILDIRQKGAPEWNIILFNRKRSPRIVQAINLDSLEILTYYQLGN